VADASRALEDVFMMVADGPRLSFFDPRIAAAGSAPK
jgi:hypothetical protein